MRCCVMDLDVSLWGGELDDYSLMTKSKREWRMKGGLDDVSHSVRCLLVMSLIACLEKYSVVVVGKVSMIEHETWSRGFHEDTLKNNMPVENG